jgi:inhibitor of cysteine peptidase
MTLAAISVMPIGSSGEGGAADESTMTGTGTVVFNDLEGGFWGIVADDGKRYDPLNLDKEFQVAGLKVRFEAKPRRDVVGFHMWGVAVELIRIEKWQ